MADNTIFRRKNGSSTSCIDLLRDRPVNSYSSTTKLFPIKLLNGLDKAKVVIRKANKKLKKKTKHINKLTNQPPKTKKYRVTRGRKEKQFTSLHFLHPACM